MEKCSFCEATTERINGDKLPEGWGKAKISVPGQTPVKVIFCPLHQKEAEEKLDLIFKVK